MKPPTEAWEQEQFAKWCNAHDLVWCHIPNEGKRTARYGAGLKRQGLSPGFPDNLIFTPPPRCYTPVALELKRNDNRSKPTKSQLEWLEQLKDCGWLTTWQRGWIRAVAWLKSLGYAPGCRCVLCQQVEQEAP